MERIRIEVDGIVAEIDPRAVRDWRVFALLADAEDNPLRLMKALPEVMQRLFGAEQFEGILQALEARDGFADVGTVQRFSIEAMQAAARGDEPAGDGELKNF